MRILKPSKQFLAFLKERKLPKSLLVIMHDNPDPDSMASGLCLKKIFEKIYQVETTLTYDGIIGRAENRQMLVECDIPLKKYKSLDLERFEAAAYVDCQPGSGNVLEFSEEKTFIVIDHHPRRKETRNIDWVDIRTKYGATATICLEYLLAHKLDVNEKEATALLYALKSETSDLGREASPADRRAYFHLYPKINFRRMFKIVNAEVTKAYFRVLSKALETAMIHNDVLVSVLEKVEVPDYVAEVADMLLRLKGVQWTLVMGRYHNNIHLSIRTLSENDDAGDIMQQLVEGIGTGGGHEMMAGGKVVRREGSPDFESIEQTLGERFLKIMRKRAQPAMLIEKNAK